ncbi:type II secretion system F family protein [Kiritimatiellaeota bacterium B1221]|nr:type II secretion system F family protein [Kiritimatiellaeota bacterium B1221]
MPKYKFVAVDQKGKEYTGNLEAADESSAEAKLREKNLFPTSVTPAGGASKAAAGKGKGKKKPAASNTNLQKEIQMPSFMQKVSPKQLMAFTRQLATLVNAGLPLVRGLQVLGRQEKNPLLKKSLAEMSDSIEGGSNFAEALVQHPKIFDKLYVNMVKAGEVGGVLDKVLLSLAEFMEKVQKIKNKVKGAMIYPIVVLSLTMLILAFLMIVIIPKFQKIFEDIMQGKPLPWLTRQVVIFSENFVVIAPIIVVVVILLSITLKFVKKTKKGAYAIDWTKLRMPLFGSLFMKSAIGRFSRTLGELMDSGVPVLQALTIVGETSGNAVVETAIHEVHDAVKEGENIAPTLESTNIFPPMVISMVEVGEETGELPQMLKRIADNFDDEVDNAVAGLTSIIEPMLIVFLAVIVGAIVIALFLPLIGIIEGLNTQ